MDIIIVYGPPASGKTTYVKQHITNEDMVYDYDAISQSITLSEYQHYMPQAHDTCILIRNMMLDYTRHISKGKLYVITTYLSKKITDRVSNYHIVRMDTDIDTCIERVNNNDRPDKDKVKQVIREWFNDGKSKPASDRKIDKETMKFYKSRKWRETRQRVLERDNYECQECKKQGIVKTIDHTKHKSLDVDHIKELDSHPNLAYDMDNLVTLCVSCHNKKHNRYQKGKPFPKKKTKWTGDEWW